jgi:hypothetical protein
VTAAELIATADELDALAFGLTGEPFPGTEPSLLDAVRPQQRPLVAARIVRSLALRDVVRWGPDGPVVTEAYRPLLAGRITPHIEVAVRVATPASARLAVACRRDSTVVVHTCEGGVHRIRADTRDLADVVMTLLALPADVADRPAGAHGGGRLRYQDLLHGTGSAPLAQAIGDYRYAAKLICVQPGCVTTTAVLAAADGPVWLATVAPDDEGDDAWVSAQPVAGAQLAGLVAAVVSGNPSHTAGSRPGPTLAS